MLKIKFKMKKRRKNHSLTSYETRVTFYRDAQQLTKCVQFTFQ